MYQFTDFPWPDSVVEEFPHQTHVMNYLQSYADHFGLLSYIRFNSKVVSLRHIHLGQEQIYGEVWDDHPPHGKWVVTVHDTLNPDSNDKIHEVEFVILCVGRFSDVPNMPKFEPGMGPDVFHGKVMHSMEYSKIDNTSAAEPVKGKRVAIVGSQKSDDNIDFQCYVANGVEHPCTMLYRSKHWNLPFAFLDGCRGFPFAFLDGFYDGVEQGSIKLKEAANGFGFWKQGIFINNDSDEPEKIKVDIVILSTGYRGIEKLIDAFSSQTFRNYITGSLNYTASLYRECVHPRIPQLANWVLSKFINSAYIRDEKSLGSRAYRWESEASMHQGNGERYSSLG